MISMGAVERLCTHNLNSTSFFFSAIREDRYFITGRAIAFSLVHGGPSPNFLSKTLFDCIVQGPEKSRPDLGYIADSEIHDKIQKVCCIFISSYSVLMMN